jgi:hypothetical protein
MTYEKVFEWCRTHNADARGIYRAKDFLIRQSDQRLPENLPSMDQIFHWDVQIGEEHLAVSTSDMERLLQGTMTLEQFKSVHRRG